MIFEPVHRIQGQDMPDVSQSEKSEFFSHLSQVGMQKIEMPIQIPLKNKTLTVISAVDAYVSLDAQEAKGIHMSRLYLELKEAMDKDVLSAASIKSVLTRFLETHAQLSQNSYLRFSFQLPLERKALLSEEIGFRQYPIVIEASLTSDKKFALDLGWEILYSSTCPCSAALARQVIADEFNRKFSDKDLFSRQEITKWILTETENWAVPHAQRSLARLMVRIKDTDLIPQLISFIDDSELKLGTPVQAAVKRVDEQEFARLNGNNLMFCEDAARKLKDLLDSNSEIEDYYIHVEHQESLHPHNAVSRVVKGVSGGFRVGHSNG